MNCQLCGTDFPPSPRNPQKVYCSRYCNLRAFRLRHGIQAARDNRKTERGLRAERRQQEVVGARLCKELYPPASRLKVQKSRLRVCKVCFRSFTKSPGRTHSPAYRRKGVYCSDACRKSGTKALPSTKARKRLWRATEKARIRMLGKQGRLESFDPLSVLRRDNWTCQICGRKTPERLRGTYKGNAPELDHRHPLSLGGDHSIANTQCACRACNLSKLNHRSTGQIPLFVNGIGRGGSELFSRLPQDRVRASFLIPFSETHD